MKIGMFLQDNRLSEEKMNEVFYDVLKRARENKLDLLVFPEHFYCPDDMLLNELAFLNYQDESGEEECDQDKISEIYKNYSKKSNCPILVSRLDKYGYIYALCISPHHEKIKWYGKHIATNYSSFELADYGTSIEELFDPMEYNGFKIGITICYDSNKPIFSVAYGDVDLLINLTGGHVDYKKWSIYQKARALENRCNYLCTMAYFNDDAKNKSYVFGYDGYGKKLPYYLDKDKKYRNNDLPNGLYIYEIDKKHEDFINFDTEKSDLDEFLNTTATVNKNISVKYSNEDILNLLTTENRIAEGLYTVKLGDETLVIIDVPEHKIEDPVFVERLFYHEKLRKLSKKRYLVLNRWDQLDKDYYSRRLSTILKVRAAENFCIVLLMSDQINECIQVGMTKNVQIVKCVNGRYGLDLKRATGPESFWKNNPKMGVKKEWRDNYELLINRLYERKLNAKKTAN